MRQFSTFRPVDTTVPVQTGPFMITADHLLRPPTVDISLALATSMGSRHPNMVGSNANL